MTAYNLKRLLLDIAYPNRCPFCNALIAYNEYYCPPCPEKLGFFGDGGEIKNVARVFTVFEYGEAAAPFVRAVKEGFDGYAVAAAAKLICAVAGDFRALGIDLITCVPPNKSSLRRRGYNPPALIAAEVSALTGIPLNAKLLAKTRETEAQKGLSAAKRRGNLDGAFSVAKNAACPATVLLIDDVRATGSTLSQAAGALLAAGAESIYAATVAASPPPSQDLGFRF
ncbi:MAG: ComF family protein [Oscillospiraceae bacterium]|jgi:ComF family protein|nr:ComF family protein [Oscillospiraceae bacterium]